LSGRPRPADRGSEADQLRALIREAHEAAAGLTAAIRNARLAIETDLYAEIKKIHAQYNDQISAQAGQYTADLERTARQLYDAWTAEEDKRLRLWEEALAGLRATVRWLEAGGLPEAQRLIMAWDALGGGSSERPPALLGDGHSSPPAQKGKQGTDAKP
jgi:hypothetical protein